MSGSTGQAAAAQLDSLAGRWWYLPRLLRLLWRVAPWELALIGTVSVASGLLLLAGLFILRGLVDSTVDLITGDGRLTTALLWVAALLCLDLLENAFYEAYDWLSLEVHDRISARVEERLLRRAGTLSLAAFERPDLYDQLHRARQALDTRLHQSLGSLFRAPATIATVVAVLAFLAAAHPVLPLVILAGMIPLNVVTLAVFRKVWILTRAQTESERTLEYLSGLMTKRDAAAEVRLFGLGRYFRDRRQRLSSRLRRERYDLAREHVAKASSMAVVDILAIGVVIGGVSLMILRGSLTVGSFAAYLSASERARDSMSATGYHLMSLDANLRYLADLIDYLEISETELLDTLPSGKMSAREDGHSTALRPKTPAIGFSSLSFAYPGTEAIVLDRLDLTIAPGERVALVGRNGAGKSTLARLLLGLYRPTSGSIKIDDIDLHEIEPSVWRRRVAAVFQDYFRFELTARENIGFGNLARLDSQPAIESAAVKSGAASFVGTLPKGYETMLGRAFDETGQNISAGQWQRLASERAYFRDASVLVLDEPTAALDAKAEVEVYKRFRDMSEGKSVLLISHRLGSARLADRIVYLEDGRIAEQGTHDQLMARNGSYALLYSVQAEWYR